MKNSFIHYFCLQSILFIFIFASCNKDENPVPESPVSEMRIDNPVLNIPCYIGCNLSDGATAEWHINEKLVGTGSRFYYTFTEEGNYTIQLKTLYKGQEFSEEHDVEVYEPGLIIGDYKTLHDYKPQSAAIDDDNNIYITYTENIPGSESNYGIVKLDPSLTTLKYSTVPPISFATNLQIPSIICKEGKIYTLSNNLFSSINIYNLPIDSLPDLTYTYHRDYESFVIKGDSIIYLRTGFDTSLYLAKYDMTNNLISEQAINIENRLLSSSKLTIKESSDNGYVLMAADANNSPYTALIVKLNAGFEIEWCNKLEGGYEYFLQDIISDKDNNVLVLFSKNDKEYLVKVGQDGNKVWEISVGDVYGFSRTGSICEVADGYVFSGGLHSGNKSTVYKVDKNGNSLWGKKFCPGEVVKIFGNDENGCTIVKRDSKDVIEKVYNDVYFPDDNVWGENEGYYSVSFINIFKLDKDGNVIDI